jgi:hypothetical protein
LVYWWLGYWWLDILVAGYTGGWIYWWLDILVAGYTGG